jgi:hypothetical protein
VRTELDKRVMKMVNDYFVKHWYIYTCI